MAIQKPQITMLNQTGATDRQVPTYDDKTSTWIPAGVLSSKVTLATIDRSNATQGQVPTWSETANAWVAGSVSTTVVQSGGGTVALDSVPVGVVAYFAATAGQLPTGWVVADGTYESASVYPDLYNLIKTTYGPTQLSNGVTTFKKPDLRGTFMKSSVATKFTCTNGVLDYAIQGSTTTSPSDYMVYLNGAHQDPTTDYTVGDGKIKFKLQPPVGVTATVLALQYAVPGTAVPCIKAIPALIPTGSTTSTPSTTVNEIGIIAHFATPTAPEGWLESDGTYKSTTAYPDLFKKLGTTYGALSSVNNVPHFKLPDLRGEFIRGLDRGRGVDTGRSIGTMQGDAYPSHSHSVNDPGHSHTIVDNGSALGDVTGLIDVGGLEPGGPTGNTYTIPSSRTGITIGAAGSGTETRPRNVALLTCIRALPAPTSSGGTIDPTLLNNKIDKPPGPKEGQILIYKNNTWTAGDMVPPTSINEVGIVAYFAAASVPVGWLVADGSYYSSIEYPDLYNILKTTHGSTKLEGGVTKFKLPDLRGEFIRGWDGGRGADLNRQFGTAQKATGVRYLIDQYVGNSSYAIGTFAINMGEIDGRITGYPTQTYTVGSDTTFYQAQAIASSGISDNTMATVRPRNVALLPCIRALPASGSSGGTIDPSLLNSKIDKPSGPKEGQILVYKSNKWVAEDILPTSINEIGVIAHFAISTVPTGWLEADGSYQSSIAYPDLYAKLTTTYGPTKYEDGVTKFKLPDLRGEFIRGWDHGRGVDTGRSIGTPQGDEFKSHTHTVTDPGHTHSVTDPGHFHNIIDRATADTGVGEGAGLDGREPNQVSSGQYPSMYTEGSRTNISIASSLTNIKIGATGVVTETRPRNVAMMTCIRALPVNVSVGGSTDSKPTSINEIGVVTYFATPTVPAGWLGADGSYQSSTAYPDLYKTLGTTYGPIKLEDNITKFKLPDLRGEFIRGWDNGKGVDAGRTFGTSQEDAFKSHKHSYLSKGADNPSYNAWNGHGGVGMQPTDTGLTGGGETRPRNIALLPCIRALPVSVGSGAIVSALGDVSPINTYSAIVQIGSYITQTGTLQFSLNNIQSKLFVYPQPLAKVFSIHVTPSSTAAMSVSNITLTSCNITNGWAGDWTPPALTCSITVHGTIESETLAATPIPAAAPVDTGTSPVKAWANFSGTRDSSGVNSTSNTNREILAGNNISKVTRDGVGSYTVYFTNNMPDTKYACTVTAGTVGVSNESWQSILYVQSTSKTISSFRILSQGDTPSGSVNDKPEISIIVMR